MDATARPEPAPASRFYLPALDGLRTVAFLMVWWTHAVSVKPGMDPWLGASRVAGMYGVPVFFVLSAYLITRLLLTERERNGKIDFKAYYVRRTLRIWPLYFLVVVLAAVEWSRRDGAPPGAILSLATFTANWYQVVTKGFNGSSAVVLWSVSVEEQFYLVWPFVLARLSVRGLRNLCVAMILLAFVGRIVIAATRQDFEPVWYATTSHLDSLALGTLLALRPAREALFTGGKVYAGFAAGLAAMVFQARFQAGGPVGVATAYTVIPFVAAALVALAIDSRGTLLENPRMVAIGRLTFGMYCFHVFVLERIVVRDAPRLALSLAITLGLAWASYHGYEKRFLRLKHRFERVKSRPD